MKKELNQVAYVLGVDWAEQTFATLELQGGNLPGPWPGTVEEARKLVDAYAENAISFVDCEWLAERVQNTAQDAWRDFGTKD
jgi:hypothetical protein